MHTNTNHNKEQWLETLKKKLEQPSPSSRFDIDEGWERLSGELFPAAPVRRTLIFKSRLVRWCSVAASIAAMTGIGITLWLHRGKEQPQTKKTTLIAEQYDGVKKEEKNFISPHVEEEIVPTNITQPQHLTREVQKREEVTLSSVVPLPSEQNSFEKESSTETPISSQNEIEEEKEGTTTPSIETITTPSQIEQMASITSPPLSFENRISIQAYASNYTTQKTYTNEQTGLQLRSLPQRQIGQNQSGYVYDELKFHHYPPFNFGIKTSFSLNDVLAFESGISYTYLRSDVDNYRPQTRVIQDLHYLGIPIGIRFRLTEFYGVQLYTTAGTQVDKAIIARLNKKKLGIHPWQFSLYGKLGASYKVIDHLNLFAEGGMSYCFNDQTRLQTYYKEHPLNFTFNIGVRVDY